MDKGIGPVVVALIGLIGVLGTWLAAALAERKRLRLALARRHLFPLQDAAEYLWFRLKNLRDDDPDLEAPEGYLDFSTLYAIGRVLACERLLGLTGAYADIEAAEKGLCAFLRTHRLDAGFRGSGFHQYYRLALAEFAMQRRGDVQEAATFTDFKARYDALGPQEQEWLDPAKKYSEGLRDDPGSLTGLIDRTYRVAHRLAETTRVPNPHDMHDLVT